MARARLPMRSTTVNTGVGGFLLQRSCWDFVYTCRLCLRNKAAAREQGEVQKLESRLQSNGRS